jgi:large conductance mechanosensitive channel
MPSIVLMFGDNKSLADLSYEGIKYGNFLQTVIDFLIVALSIFFAVRLVCKLRFKKKEEEAAPVEAPAPPPTPEDILLLREIRDALKNK